MLAAATFTMPVALGNVATSGYNGSFNWTAGQCPFDAAKNSLNQMLGYANDNQGKRIRVQIAVSFIVEEPPPPAGVRNPAEPLVALLAPSAPPDPAAH